MLRPLDADRLEPAGVPCGEGDPGGQGRVVRGVRRMGRVPVGACVRVILRQPVIGLYGRHARVVDVDDPGPAPRTAVAAARRRPVYLVGDPSPVTAPELDRAVG